MSQKAVATRRCSPLRGFAHSRAQKRSTAIATAMYIATAAATTMSTAAAKVHITARSAQREDPEDEVRPFAGKTAPKARMYQHEARTSLDKWLQQVTDVDKDSWRNFAESRAAAKWMVSAQSADYDQSCRPL